MKNLFFITALIASFSLAFTEPAPLKTISADVTKSTITWKGAKVVMGSHHGEIALKSGSLDVEGRKIKGGTFVIDMTSINCLDLSGNSKQRLEGHLRSDDFFSVETYPTATFTIKTATPGSGYEYQIKGDLTIKGKTHPIEFKAKMSKEGNGTKFTADITVDRSKYDVRYGSDKFFDNLGDNAIKNDFEIGVSLVVNESLI
jgi:polyisoprenoid-binding protein YceI